MELLWKEVLTSLRDQLNPQTYDTWFRPLRLLRLDPGVLELEAPNRFFKEWLTEHYVGLVRDTLRTLTQREFSIAIQVGVQPDAPAPPAPRTHEIPVHEESGPLIPKYTFESFVVGASNQFAHAACMAVATTPAHHYNPLFLYGGVGLGKTHLLNAIGHEILHYRPGLRISYISSERFMNELINSIRYERMPEFRARYRAESDVLLMDDIQFISGKERTQEEFFHTFNSLYESRRQIVLTSDQFPREIDGLEERLRNRFQWGLIADIQPPDTETKVAILKKKAERDNIALPDDVALFLATHTSSNVRELEGSLVRIGAYAFLTGRSLTLELAHEVLKDFLRDRSPEITIDTIQKLVAAHFNLKIADLKSPRKLKAIAFPRQIAMYLARKHTGASFPEIGGRFGGKDHSTVIHAVRKIEDRLKTDSQLRSTIDTLAASLTQ